MNEVNPNKPLPKRRTRPVIMALALFPTALITSFYAIVALNWWATAANDFGAALDRETPSSNALAGAHAVSTALFFSILAVITVVRKRPLRRENRIKGWVLPIAVMVAMGITASGDPRALPLPLAVVATALVVGGTIFTLYSLRFLGRHFGVVSDVRGLVTHGPYAWVRHPLYAGEAITLAGVAIAVASPVTIAAFIIGQAVQAWRARTEEEALASVFPDYQAYAERTPMLIPGLRLRRAPVPVMSAPE